MGRTQAAPEFADRIRQALSEAELTQEALARSVGVTLGAVQRWCSGRSEPKGRQLIALGRALDRDPAWFYDTGAAA